MKQVAPLVLLTSVLLLCLDLRLRSQTPPQDHTARGGSADPGQEQTDLPLRGGTETPLRLEERLQEDPSPPLSLQDVYIAVKTSGRFHHSRLELLLQTWISKTKDQTFIFTDAEDEALKAAGFHVEVTRCESDHSQAALACKTSAEYDGFMSSDKRWFCHVDDDNYLNPGALLTLLQSFPQNAEVYVGRASLDRPITAHELLEGNKTREVRFWFATGGAGFCLSRALAERMSPWASGPRFLQTSALIRLPDDCTVGFIVEQRLGRPMVHCPLFHSHLENLQMVPQQELSRQVTLSYGLLEEKMNTIEIRGSFSVEEDPSRFRSLHCLLFPFTSWCP